MKPSSLTHRERVRLALEHRTTDRVPMSQLCAGINRPAREALNEWLRRERGLSVEQYLRPLIDVKHVAPPYVGPPQAEGTDFWGVRRRPVSYGADSYMEIDHYPLGEVEDAAELDDYPWPSTDWFDYDALPGRIRALDEQADSELAIVAVAGAVFETSWYMRGLERFLIDLVVNPDLARGILTRVAGFFTANARRVFQTTDGRIDLAFTADDLAGQDGPLLAPEMWADTIKPLHVELNATIHEFGARVVYHSDGDVTRFVPGLIEMGIDVLEALQFEAGEMDPEFLKREYGDRLCFEGGISVQKTLPFGAPDDVRREVEDRIRVLGRGGGYILSPSHAVQAGTPPENIVAMFDTAASTPMA